MGERNSQPAQRRPGVFNALASAMAGRNDPQAGSRQRGGGAVYRGDIQIQMTPAQQAEYRRRAEAARAWAASPEGRRAAAAAARQQR